MMRNEEHNPEGCGGESPRRSIGSLIRAAADGELTDAELAEFDRLCAERNCTQDRVRFEQTLRESCGRVMKSAPCCSNELRERIRAIAAESRIQPALTQPELNQSIVLPPPSAFPSVPVPDLVAGPGTDASDTGDSGPEAMAVRTRSVSFWRRSPGMMAAAAVLLSVAGVLIWQASSLPEGPLPPGMTRTEVAYRDRVAGFVSDEHDRCTRSENAAASKLILRDAESAQSHFSEEFGISQVSLTADPAEAGSIVFWGAGDCHLPGASKSAHVRFDAMSPDGTPMRLSLFVMPDNHRLPIEPGTTYKVGSDACDRSGVRLFAWRSDELVYLLVTEAEDNFCGIVRRSLHAPAQVAGL